jgi:uroporphyrinogen-III synthase
MTKPRILITRSPHQASELAAALRAHGADPILIPTIELTAPTTYAPLDAALTHLGQFHWLLFTSANAVEAFAARIKQLSILYPLPSTLCLTAAIGPATARALEAIGLTPTLIPEQAVAESFATALLPHAHQPDGGPTRFLLIRAETARDHLPDALRAAGAEVIIAPAYRTIIPEASVKAIRDLFATAANHPTAITFTSSSAAENLFALLKSANRTLPPGILRASIGPITSQTLINLGYPPQIEAQQATVTSLVEALKKSPGLKFQVRP